MSIGDNIKKRRELRGLKQSELADLVGVSDKTVSSWEINRTEPKMGMIEKVSIALRCKKTDIIGIDDSSDTGTLNKKDEKDIAKDLESIMKKLSNSEDGPASFEGTDIPEADQELFAGQVELMLRRLKAINKELYNPNKK